MDNSISLLRNFRSSVLGNVIQLQIRFSGLDNAGCIFYIEILLQKNLIQPGDGILGIVKGNKYNSS